MHKPRFSNLLNEKIVLKTCVWKLDWFQLPSCSCLGSKNNLTFREQEKVENSKPYIKERNHLTRTESCSTTTNVKKNNNNIRKKKPGRLFESPTCY